MANVAGNEAPFQQSLKRMRLSYSLSRKVKLGHCFTISMPGQLSSSATAGADRDC